MTEKNPFLISSKIYNSKINFNYFSYFQINDSYFTYNFAQKENNGNFEIIEKKNLCESQGNFSIGKNNALTMVPKLALNNISDLVELLI